MSFFKAIKTDSKKALRSNRTKSCAIAFLYLAVHFLFFSLYKLLFELLGIPHYFFYFNPLDSSSFLPSFSPSYIFFFIGYLLVNLLAVIPLYLGIKKWFFFLGGGSSKSITSVFYFFSSFKAYIKSMGLFLNVAIRKLFWSSIFIFIPYLASEYLIFSISKTNPLIFSGASGKVMLFSLIALKFIIVIIGSAIAFYLFSAYFCAPYYMARDGLSSFKAINLSKKAVKGEKFEIFKFKLSFILYDALRIFVLPIIYVLPYKETSFSLYARFLMEKLERESSISTPLPSEANNIL